jgi:hypothetical protein
METAHYLLVLIEERPKTIPHRKNFFDKFKKNKTPATFVDSYLENLKSIGLADRCIAGLESPTINHVYTWIEHFLYQDMSPHKAQKLKNEALKLYQQKKTEKVPHNELGLALADILESFNKS